MLTVRVLRGIATAMAFLAWAAAAQAMKLSIVKFNGTPPLLQAEGKITVGDTEKINALLEGGEIEERIIVFDSPGGDVFESLSLGRFLNFNHFTTVVAPGFECVSACFFSFSGGEVREVMAGGKLGVHQFYGGSPAMASQSATQYITAEISKFLRQVGISSEAFDIALQTPPTKMHIFTERELREFRITTGLAKADLAERMANELGISKAEWLQRRAAYLKADRSMCNGLTSAALDLCIYALQLKFKIER